MSALLFCSVAKTEQNEHRKVKNDISINYKSQMESYLKGLTSLSSDFVQQNMDGTIVSGHISLLKKKGDSQKVRIDYEEKVGQKILIDGGVLTVTDLSTNKQDSCSISQTPIYSILDHGINLSKEPHTINNDDKFYVTLEISKITPSGNMSIKLIFSKYDNGNIKNLEGWIVKEPNGSEISISFMVDSLFVNDKTKIKTGIFEKKYKSS